MDRMTPQEAAFVLAQRGRIVPDLSDVLTPQDWDDAGHELRADCYLEALFAVREALPELRRARDILRGTTDPLAPCVVAAIRSAEARIRHALTALEGQ